MAVQTGEPDPVDDLQEIFVTGVRAMTDGDTRAAIEAFQQAKADARLRSACGNFLGQMYFDRGWRDEAIDAWNAALTAHPNRDDALGVELQTRLAHALHQRV